MQVRFKIPSRSFEPSLRAAVYLRSDRRERVCSMCGIKESELIAAGKWGGVLLPIGIAVLIILCSAGVGFCIYYAVKKMKYIPVPTEDLENDEVAKAAAEAIIVTSENGAEEKF